MPKLILDQVRKEYATPAESLVVLESVSLELNGGDNLAIVGPSGSGKSTLLHIVGTLDTPTSGTVTLHGINPFQLNEKGLARFRNQNVGFIFQDHHLLPQLTALENVLVPTLAKGHATSHEVDRAKRLLDQVGLANRATHLPSALSGGERQRVAIARALIFEPTLLLADEPTGNLDHVNANAISDLLLEMQANGDGETIMMVVTHSEDLAKRMSRCLELSSGQLAEATG
ncbi:MAG: ABC transporter ATP-binding protein [Planctomycetales bacterium]|nr:ABC transporter ATP-binding protein [Planctomycetales bacterium]